jgi:heterodisulfide reductase subunit D
MRLAVYTNQIYSCLRCGFCFDHAVGGQEKICPSYVTYGMESYGARGKMAIARALVDGALDYDADVAKRVYACTECGACEEQCFKYLSLLDIYRAMKADLAERELVPAELAGVGRAVADAGNPYGQARGKRLGWAPGTDRVGKKAETVFFVGCTPAYVRRGIARGAYQVLEAAGVDFALLDDEVCCGHPHLAVGDLEGAREAAGKNVAAIEASGATQVVFACPGCLQMFREEVPDLLGRPLPFRVLHATELLGERSAIGGVRLRKQSRVVVYHDPCNLGRGLGIYDAPRRAIDAVPGARRVEMRRSGAGSFCCGNGDFVRFGYEPMAVENEEARWNEAVATGADLLLSACPACQIAFLDAKRRAKSTVDVLDVVEWLATAI